MCHINRINNEHNRCRKLYLLANKIIPQSVHVLLQCEEWCRFFKVVCRWLQCWCQREDCYSARHSGGSRLKEQPAPGAWRLLCVCVCLHACSETKCLGSQKTNRDTCQLPLPAADKTGKRMCLASSTFACLWKGRKGWTNGYLTHFYL